MNSTLKRRVSLRDSYIRKLRNEGTRKVYRTFHNGKGCVLKRKPLKKVARSHRHRLMAYQAQAEAFLKQPENEYCLICTVRREHGENILINMATEIHHWAGRIGRLLCYIPYFRPSCYRCRCWPHDNARQAREWGLLAPPAQWNVFPGDGTN